MIALHLPYLKLDRDLLSCSISRNDSPASVQDPSVYKSSTSQTPFRFNESTGRCVCILLVTTRIRNQARGGVQNPAKETCLEEMSTKIRRCQVTSRECHGYLLEVMQATCALTLNWTFETVSLNLKATETAGRTHSIPNLAATLGTCRPLSLSKFQTELNSILERP